MPHLRVHDVSATRISWTLHLLEEPVDFCATDSISSRSLARCSAMLLLSRCRRCSPAFFQHFFTGQLLDKFLVSRLELLGMRTQKETSFFSLSLAHQERKLQRFHGCCQLARFSTPGPCNQQRQCLHIHLHLALRLNKIVNQIHWLTIGTSCCHAQYENKI